MRDSDVKRGYSWLNKKSVMAVGEPLPAGTQLMVAEKWQHKFINVVLVEPFLGDPDIDTVVATWTNDRGVRNKRQLLSAFGVTVLAPLEPVTTEYADY